MKNGKHNAFTLIELLVVMAIIGLLATAVLASMSYAHKSGRDTRRFEDLRELQQAINMFQNDKGRLPDATQDNAVGKIETGSNLMQALSAYSSAQDLQDPVNDSDHYYYYDNNANCDGNSVTIIYANKLEAKKGNGDLIGCSSLQSNSHSLKNSDTYIIMLDNKI